jgi:hypothetical protein
VKKLLVLVPVEDTPSSKSRQTGLTSKPAKLKPAATEPRTAEDNPKDKDFVPPRHPCPRSESPIEDIPLDKHGNEIVEDLPPVPVRGFPVLAEYS